MSCWDRRVSRRAMIDRDRTTSKKLTQILRHDAVRHRLQMRTDGYVLVQDVLKLKPLRSLRVTTTDLERVVLNNSKQRFSIVAERDGLLIRAVQGHSLAFVQGAALMTKLLPSHSDLPEVCVHGTYQVHVAAILRDGLMAGGTAGVTWRRHVHFSPVPPGDRRAYSWLRPDCEVVVWLNLLDALRADVPFFRAQNDVIASPGVGGVVPAVFIQMVTEVGSGAVLWPSLGVSLSVDAGASVPRQSAAAPCTALASTPATTLMAAPAAPPTSQQQAIEEVEEQAIEEVEEQQFADLVILLEAMPPNSSTDFVGLGTPPATLDPWLDLGQHAIRRHLLSEPL